MPTIRIRESSLFASLIRRLILVPLAVAGIVAPGCVFVQARFQQSTQVTAPHVSGSALAVEAHNGSIAVNKGAGSEVLIKATLRMVTEERLTQATIMANRNGAGVLEISAKPPEGGWRSGEGCSFDIEVPDAAGLDAKSNNGSIRIGGLSGPAKLKTSNGAIKVNGHSGDVDADTSNGSVTVTDVSGKTRVDTSNGSVTVKLTSQNAGPVDIDTSNGSVTLELSSAFRGGLDVRTSNGSVNLPREAPAGVRKFESHTSRRSGHLGLDEGPKSVIQTSNGSVTVRFAG